MGDESVKVTERIFRAPGAPCGAHHWTPWWHCTLYDPYERVNVWSHGLPGVFFLLLGLYSYLSTGPGSASTWAHNPPGIFCFCAAMTHLGSAATHVYPDTFALEKLDHFGIVALVVGTPLTALMAHEHGKIPMDVKIVFAAMLAAALLSPAWRVAGFSLGTVAAIVLHWKEVINANLAIQIVLYGMSAVFFLRAKFLEVKVERWQGLYDHHFLHYIVTVASVMHVVYIQTAMTHAQS